MANSHPLSHLTLLILSSICVAARAADTDWPMYNLNYQSQRYVELHGINARNVSHLREGCRVRVDGAGSFQSGLLLVGGLLYATSATSTVAIDPTDCTVAW